MLTPEVSPAHTHRQCSSTRVCSELPELQTPTPQSSVCIPVCVSVRVGVGVVSVMSGHGHGHGPGGHSCGCGAEHEPSERGLEYGLFQKIHLDKLQCLNEVSDGSGRTVFKPWEHRTDRDKVPGPGPGPGPGRGGGQAGSQYRGLSRSTCCSNIRKGGFKVSVQQR